MGKQSLGLEQIYCVFIETVHYGKKMCKLYQLISLYIYKSLLSNLQHTIYALEREQQINLTDSADPMLYVLKIVLGFRTTIPSTVCLNLGYCLSR